MVQTRTMVDLSSRDKSILSAIFDPEASQGPLTTPDSHISSLPQYDEAEFTAIRAEEVAIIQVLGKEPDKVTESIRDLSVLIRKYPEYASAYINRAQATRLTLSVDDIFTESHAQSTGELMSDLDKGIKLATPSSSDAYSNHQKDVLSAAHTHRGFLLLKAADRVRNGQLISGRSLGTISGDEIEEWANADFMAGAKYGNKMAQEMTVKTNPYAKMCGAIVKEAMRKEIEEATAQF